RPGHAEPGQGALVVPGGGVGGASSRGACRRAVALHARAPGTCVVVPGALAVMGVAVPSGEPQEKRSGATPKGGPSFLGYCIGWSPNPPLGCSTIRERGSEDRLRFGGLLPRFRRVDYLPGPLPVVRGDAVSTAQFPAAEWPTGAGRGRVLLDRRTEFRGARGGGLPGWPLLGVLWGRHVRVDVVHVDCRGVVFDAVPELGGGGLFGAVPGLQCVPRVREGLHVLLRGGCGLQLLHGRLL